MGNVCFLLPHCNPQMFYVEKFVFVQFSKIVLLRGRIFRSLKSIFKRFLFAIITYFGNNNRQHPQEFFKNMQFGKIAAAGFKCNLSVANKDLRLLQTCLKPEKCAIPKKSVTRGISQQIEQMINNICVAIVVSESFIVFELFVSNYKLISELKKYISI